MGDIPRTYVGTFRGREELQVPGSVSTEGYNINQDGSVVGHYDTADGRRHGFIARLAAEPPTQPTVFEYTFESIDVPGIDLLRLSASSDYEDYAGSTLGPDGEKMVGFTLIDGVFKTHDFPGSKTPFSKHLAIMGTPQVTMKIPRGYTTGLSWKMVNYDNMIFPVLSRQRYGASVTKLEH